MVLSLNIGYATYLLNTIYFILKLYFLIDNEKPVINVTTFLYLFLALAASDFLENYKKDTTWLQLIGV